MTNERPILFSTEMVRAIRAGLKTQTRRIVTKRNSTVEGYPNYRFWDELDFENAEPRDKNPAMMLLCGTAGSLDFPRDIHLRVPSPTEDTFHRVRPKIEIGDHLWVRESFYTDVPMDGFDVYLDHIYYKADGTCCEQIPECQCTTEGKPKWRPSIHMPSWASRITLEVVNVRVERLQDISEADAIAEGVGELDGILNEAALCAQAKVIGIPATEHRVWFAVVWDSINAERAPWASNPWVFVIEFRTLTPSREIHDLSSEVQTGAKEDA